MTTKELSQIKEGDVIYDESGGIVYDVIKVYESGLLTDWRWANSCGRFIEDYFLTYEELLCKDIMLIRGDKIMKENIYMNVGDKFILHSENGRDYTIEIVNVNEFREPSLRYAADVWDDEGNYLGDVMFFGDEFFEKNKSKIEKIGGVHHMGTKVEVEE